MDPLGEGDCFVCRVDIFDQNGKLISAETGNCVSGSEHSFQTAGDGDEQLIANDMAQTVIDDFETIQAEKQHCENLAGIALVSS